jgi:GAF domain-containing protein
LLEQQAATNQVIEAIGRPGFELQPIFETVAEHAVRLCRADAAQIFIHDTDHYRLATASGGSDEYRSWIAARAISPGQGTLVGRVGLDRRSVLVADILADPAYEWSEAQRLGGFRSIVAIPMLSDDEVIGVISLWRREVDPFTPREIEVATTFAAQGAVAIRNANLFQQLELRTLELAQSVEELEGLREVGEAVNSTLDLHDVLSTIVMHAVQLSGTEGGSIFEFDEKEQAFRIRAAFGTSAELLDALRATRVGLDDTLVGRATSTRTSIAVTDIDEAPGDAHLAQLSRAGWHSMLAVPLVREDTILGALVVRRRTVGAFSPKVIELVETFASQSALAIQHARLFQQLELRTLELAQSVEELEGLREVGEAVNSTLDLHDVLSTIVMHAVQLSGTEGGSIFEFDEKEQAFRIRAAFGTSAELLDALRATRVGLDDTLVGRATSTRTSIAVTDIDEAPGDAHLAQLSRAGWHSMLAVPLVREDTILGALVVRRRTVGAFSPKVIELVETFASQSALAIQHARLFQQLELASRQLTRWNQELEQRVESQVEQIERIGRLKRFLSPAVADLIVSGGDESFLESHRREITVVFCDLRGFTSFAETVEPEDTMSVLREYHAALGELVFQYEGTLERFTGDGLMVFFNDPVACADGPARAVRMAVEMRARIVDIARGWRRQGHVLGFGVGIAQGYATLGRVGFEGRYDYAAIGTVTNLAARLCEAASDGQILVTERVLAEVERFVGVEEIEEMTPKGFSRPVIPHNVLSIDDRAG